MSQRVSTNPPTGFRDFFGDEALERQKILEKIAHTYEGFGFSPLETPALERLEILQGSGGGENEKLIFKVMKRGEKLAESLRDAKTEEDIADFGMRFDMTVPLSRVVSEYKGEISFPFKAYHLGPVWRAERAQKGRFREFIQADADIIGSAHWSADAEVIQAGVMAVAATGASGFELRINHRALLRSLLRAEGVADERANDFLIVLDKKDKLPLPDLKTELESLTQKSLSSQFMKLLEGRLELESIQLPEGECVAQELSRLIKHLEGLNLPLQAIRFDPSLARGLGYYTGSIFELRHPEAGYSFGGGGRYDELIGRFSKESLPAVGFSIGFDRLALLLSGEAQKSGPKKRWKERALFVPVFSEETRAAVSALAQSLRVQGWLVDLYPDDGKLKTQFKFADQRAYRWCLIAGEDEIKQNQFKIKDMKLNTEESLGEEALRKKLAEILKSDR